jgi:pimeloyl-ACP methyl ester carboxylesterase
MTPYSVAMFGRTVAVMAALAITVSACSSEPAVSESTSRPVDAADDLSNDPEPDADPDVTPDDDPTDTTSNGGSSDGSSDGGADNPDDPNPVDQSDLPPFEPDQIAWDDFGDGVDVGLLDVPVDYANPDGAQFELFLARHHARDADARIGSLLVNPGGPGFGGSDFALFAPQIFDRDLLDHFDIIGWDPRGTGESQPPIDCIDDFDPYFTAIDSTPETESERAEMVGIAEEFADTCVARNAAIIDFVGTNNSARDIDTIRRSLGEDQITYFGFSYGSELGATWATLFPETVRAAVLDGAADPNADSLESSLQQMRGFQASLETFLGRCDRDPGCEFGGDDGATAAYLDLLADLDAAPLDVDPDRPPVNRDVALVATIQAMYSESLWSTLERSLADAIDGDGSGLLELNDSYYQRRPDGSYGNELEAFQAISCADTTDRPTVEETDAEAPLFNEAAPLLVPPGSIGSYFCTFFPPALDPRVEITGNGAGPIVVIGTTGDPATPFASTVRMSETLEDGRLVVVDADQHTGYGVNRCVIEVVNRYFVDLEPPEPRTECG